MEKLKYEIIPNDSLVDIQISGSFYSKLKDLSLKLGQSVPVDEFKTILKKLEGSEPETNLFELNLSVVLALIFEIENCAKAQDKTKQVEIDAEPAN
jgi:hypothetical protein